MKKSLSQSAIKSPITAATVSIMSHAICCGIPLLFIILGIGGLSVSAFFSQYHWFFTALGAASLAYGIFSYWKTYHSSSCDCCPSQKLTRRCSFCLLLFAAALQSSMIIWLSSMALASPTLPEEQPQLPQTSAAFQLSNLHCPGCVVKITKQAETLENVIDAEGSFTDSILIVHSSENIAEAAA